MKTTAQLPSKFTKREQESNRKKWVAALRSGKYLQGRGALKSRDKYCCLGVACQLFHEKYPENSHWSDDEAARFLSYKPGDGNGERQVGVLTNHVQDWLGLSTDDGSYKKVRGGTYSLVSLNDDKKLSFKQIAVIIEKTKGLIK